MHPLVELWHAFHKLYEENLSCPHKFREGSSMSLSPARFISAIRSSVNTKMLYVLEVQVSPQVKHDFRLAISTTRFAPDSSFCSSDGGLA